MEFADCILDDLIPAVHQSNSDLAHQAADLLDSWDRRADETSRGIVLFAEWAAMLGPDPFAIPFDPHAPRTTPDGLKDPAAAIVTLEWAARKVIATYGRLDVPWGEVFRFRLADRDLPANGGPAELGIFRVVQFDPDRDGRFRASAGDSYVALIEFANPPPRPRSARLRQCFPTPLPPPG
jgi:acyl-homoserine-lactone acylase